MHSTLNPYSADTFTSPVLIVFSLGDGHSFVTRLVHIDPEQANSVLQQNGKRLVLINVQCLPYSVVCWVLISDIIEFTALPTGRPTHVGLVTTYNTQRATVMMETKTTSSP